MPPLETDLHDGLLVLRLDHGKANAISTEVAFALP